MSFIDKVKEMLGQHPDQAKGGVDKAGDMVDDKTGGKYADKVDKAQEKAGDYIDHSSGQGQPNTDQAQDGAQDDQGGRPGQSGS
ncbi:antitoxin [Actinomadura harenae]|uniref:Antitoxin n=1 Tax=Actinomadura harenae TaxID=2483351 RepID=A0A3M2MEZ0_9ACTN|nr:antitoxin [Actinomadura harenae]RMI47185.1 antitoxin [Actinomadura harenae]